MSSGQDAVDAGGENRNVAPRGGHTHQEAEVVTDEYFKSDYYDMEHRTKGGQRGYALILNNNKTPKNVDDALTAEKLLKDMGFVGIRGPDKTMILTDLTKNEMECALKEAARLDHKNNDCFVCVIISQGEEGYVFARDGKVEIDVLATHIKGNFCKSLTMKPKLFFIQSCDESWLTASDAVGEDEMEADDMTTVKRRIPNESDFLMMHSTVPGALNTNGDGSYFINFIKDVFTETCQNGLPAWQSIDLFSLLTRVNRKMANKLEIQHSTAFRRMKNKLPVVTSMLTKDLIFKPVN